MLRVKYNTYDLCNISLKTIIILIYTCLEPVKEYYNELINVFQELPQCTYHYEWQILCKDFNSQFIGNPLTYWYIKRVSDSNYYTLIIFLLTTIQWHGTVLIHNNNASRILSKF